MTTDDVDNVFSYHPPRGNQAERYELLRGQARYSAKLILQLCPASREQSLAITHLQQVVMFANAAIAINETGGVPADVPPAVFSRPECPFHYCDQPAPHTACEERCRHVDAKQLNPKP